MNWCLVMFLRGGKVNVVKYWWNCRKVKVKQVITDRLTDDQDRVQSVHNLFNLFSDTDSEFIECQTPRKKLYSTDISNHLSGYTDLEKL